MIFPLTQFRPSASPRHSRSRGGSVLEAAIIIPILVSLAFGMTEFSYFFFVKHTLEGAAREGARTAITPTATNATVTAAAQAQITAAGGTGWGATVSITDTSGNPITISGLSAGSTIEVTVTCTWSTVGVHPLGIIPGSKQVIGTCVMLKEG
jgi:Flp pilus assembly protein TadG